MLVQEIMTAGPSCCTAGTAMDTVGRLMLEHNCGAIPVVDGLDTMRPVGIVTDRDIVCRLLAAGREPLRTTAKDAMTVDLVTVTPETAIDDCCRIMEENQIRRLLVVDAKGRCVGVLSQTDIALIEDRPKRFGDLLRAISYPRERPSHVPPPASVREVGEPLHPRKALLPTGVSPTIDLEWQPWVFAPGQLPEQPGVFCVWAAPVQLGTHATPIIEVSEIELLYIGEAANIAHRAANHEERPCWEAKRGRPNERFVYTASALPDVNEEWRMAVKRCLVSTYRPPCNQEEYTYGYEATVTIRNAGVTFGKLLGRHTCRGTGSAPGR